MNCKLFFTVPIMFMLLIMSGGLFSCTKSGFLDSKANTAFDENSTFSDSLRTIEFLTGIYPDVNLSWNPGWFNGGGGLESSCDEAEPRDLTTSNSANLFTNAVLSSTNTGTLNIWTTAYTDIRRVNILLQDVGKSPLSDVMKDRLRGEGRFLRAWYYFMLLKAYGGLPIVQDTVYQAGYKINVPRSSFEQTVNYVSAECDTAAALLPSLDATAANSAYSNNTDFGRATKGAAMGLKSRLLLYAASPLFNGGATATDPVFGYPAVDKERWKAAADAAEAVISSGKYGLYVDNATALGYGFSDLFTLRTGGFAEATGSQPTQLGEYLFCYPRQSNKILEAKWDPPTRQSGTTAADTYPYQELVDAFPDVNGVDISDPATIYDPANPYANRDPRLDNTVLHNNSMRYLNSAVSLQPVNISYTGSTASADANGTTTGYFVRKMLDKSTTNGGGPNSNRSDPLMRYSEILLNAAEAHNEYDGPTARVYQLLAMIRQRAGINPGTDNLYGCKSGLSQDDMRLFIQNERRIELAFEEHRFWDVRRWKIAMTTENKTFTGMKVTKSGSSFIYERFNVRAHNFTQAMYLFPISQGEIVKSSLLKENPGW